MSESSIRTAAGLRAGALFASAVIAAIEPLFDPTFAAGGGGGIVVGLARAGGTAGAVARGAGGDVLGEFARGTAGGDVPGGDVRTGGATLDGLGLVGGVTLAVPARTAPDGGFDRGIGTALLGERGRALVGLDGGFDDGAGIDPVGVFTRRIPDAC